MTTPKRKHMNVLKRLAETPDEFVHQHDLPDGNGMVSPGRSASGSTLFDLHVDGYVIRREAAPGVVWHSYQIADAGLRVVNGDGE